LALSLFEPCFACCFAADDHETDYEFGGGSDEDEQLVDGEPR